MSQHLTIGWKLTSTRCSVSAQLCFVLIILAQELLFCSQEYTRYLCVPFKLSCWRSAISQAGHVDLMARRTNESEKINRTSTEQQEASSKWWGTAASPAFVSIWCDFRRLSPSKTTVLLNKSKYSVSFLSLESKINTKFSRKPSCLSLCCCFPSGKNFHFSPFVKSHYEQWKDKHQPTCVVGTWPVRDT